MDGGENGRGEIENYIKFIEKLKKSKKKMN